MKKYLETEKDVINALKEGKIVYGESFPLYHYKMIDGFICGQCSENTQFIINCTMDMGKKFYIEEQEPLAIEEEKPFTIEVGKFYKTRDGRKAYCIYKEEGNLYPNYCVIVGDGDCKKSYTEDGLVFYDEEDDRDIVDYWEE